jgi:hypothetical protein
MGTGLYVIIFLLDAATAASSADVSTPSNDNPVSI